MSHLEGLRRAVAAARRARHVLGLGGSIARGWFGRPKTPTRVVMDLTRRCNLKCEMCSTWQVAAGHELTVEEIRATLAQLPGLYWLDVTGGEIFVRRDATRVVQAVLASSPALRVLHFPTNGWHTRRIVEACRAARVQRPEVELIVTVSIDGPEALHDEIRGVPGSFSRAVATYLALREIPGVDCHVGTTVTPSNVHQVGELEAALTRAIPGFDPRRWHWNLLQVSGHFFHNAHLAGAPAPDEQRLILTHLRRRGLPRSLVEVMELVFLLNLVFYRRGEPAGVVCQALETSCFISPEGDVYPCHVYDRPLGNVRRDSIESLWDSTAVRQARADVERLACGGCFTPCEAYPALAGAPIDTVKHTARRALTLAVERARGRQGAAPGARRRRRLPVA